MKKHLLSLCVLLFALTPVQTKTQALTFTELPIKQKTEQWSVEITEAKNAKELASPKKGEYNVYSMEIKNIGEAAATVDVQLYRNDSDSTTRFSLFGCPENCVRQKEDLISLAKSLNDGAPLKFNHFMVSEKASELEVVIIWTQKGKEGRQLKQTFTFS
ncbi:hypothetical protein [Bacillus halotolerans]|uniref:hypothetical protein n=1 Tax=Bacillus halotolerans TaxID=260554 RepID=UPI002DB72B68|nr:hypothetical protein [Bacillus halotolerans]MEC1665308.1 hypothetical protein [Bacillus halotolerans]